MYRFSQIVLFSLILIFGLGLELTVITFSYSYLNPQNQVVSNAFALFGIYRPVNFEWSMLIFLCIAATIAFALKAISVYRLGLLGQMQRVELSDKKLNSILIGLRTRKYINNPNLQKDLIAEIDFGVGNVYVPLIGIVSAIISVLFYSLTVALISLKIACIVFLSLFSFYLTLVVTGRNYTSQLGEERQNLTLVRHVIVDVVSSRAIQLFLNNNLQNIFGNYRESIIRISRNYSNISLVSSLPRIIMEAVFLIGLVLSAYWIANSASDADIVDLIFTVILAFGRIQPQVSIVYQNLVTVKHGLKSFPDGLALFSNSSQKSGILNLNQQHENFEFETLKVNGLRNNRSIVFNKGECVVIKGKSGSGKTTLIENICGVRSELNGKIEINGKSIEGQQGSVQNSIVYCPQLPTLFKTSLKDNITMTNGSFGVYDVERLRIHFERFGLLELFDPVITSADLSALPLSAGERQRLSLLISLSVVGKSILILDEPTANLDPTNKRKVFDYLVELARTQFDLTLIVSHDPFVDSNIRIVDLS